MLRCALIIVAFLACFSHSGRAAGSSNEFLAHLVGHLYRHGESFACFGRQYSAAHLAAHPGQQVTFMKALVDAHFSEPWAPHQPAVYMYQLRLAFRFEEKAPATTGLKVSGMPPVAVRMVYCFVTEPLGIATTVAPPSRATPAT